jgi:polar amino acid transport system substrate-binding protein
MKRSILGLFLAFLLIAPVANAASPVLSRIMESGTLRVGVSGSQPPLNFTTKDGELSGLEIDLAKGLAQTMGAKAVFVKKPFGELLSTLEAGEVDLVMSGMSITPGRNIKVPFVGPYFLSGKSILTKSSVLAQAENADDLDALNLKIAALAGSTSERFVEAVIPSAELMSTENYEQAVQALIDDKVQAVVADFEACALGVLLNPKANLTTLQKPLTVEPIGIAVAPGDPLLVNFLENTLGGLEASGLLEALRVRWLENGDWVETLP